MYQAGVAMTGLAESQARVEEALVTGLLGDRATTMTGLAENQARVEEDPIGWAGNHLQFFSIDRPFKERRPSINWLLSRYST